MIYSSYRRKTISSLSFKSLLHFQIQMDIILKIIVKGGNFAVETFKEDKSNSSV